EKIEHACSEAKRAGAQRFSIVTSGKTLDMDEIAAVAAAAETTRDKCGIPVCASLGSLDREKLQCLGAAGIERIHCNLETSERFFPKVCTTHAWRSKVETVKAAKEEGFEVCCGGIFGLGETWEDRLDMALTLKELNVESVPLNFLVRVPGTPLAEARPLEPLEILRIIAVFRHVLPDKDIRVCGGREANLRSLQSWIFYAGANGVMLGDYLTTTGNPPEEDLQMVRDLGLKARSRVKGEK
ncbi:MAG: biotin synthase BioB, partial [Planctomycetota bacterium]